MLVSDAALARALWRHGGVALWAAEELGVSRRMVIERLRADDALRWVQAQAVAADLRRQEVALAAIWAELSPAARAEVLKHLRGSGAR